MRSTNRQNPRCQYRRHLDHIQVAINGGIYKKHGFDVENIQVGSSATVVQSLIAGEVSFAHVGAVPAVAVVAGGIDLKIIAVFMNRFNYIMATLPELQKPQDLKGKTLAISRLGSGDEFATREALRRWGLDPDKDVRKFSGASILNSPNEMTIRPYHEGGRSARACSKRSNRSIRSSCSTNPFRSDGLNGLNYLNWQRASLFAVKSLLWLRRSCARMIVES